MMENIKCGINLWYNYVDQFNCSEKKTSDGSGTLILVRCIIHMWQILLQVLMYLFQNLILIN